MKKIINYTIMAISSCASALMLYLFGSYCWDIIFGYKVNVTNVITGISYTKIIHPSGMEHIVGTLAILSIFVLATLVCNQIRKDLNERSKKEA